MVDVAIECSTKCVPLRSVGVTPLPHYYGDIRLPMNRRASSWLTSCATLLPVGRIHGLSRVPDSTLMTCHGLGPRWAARKPWQLATWVLPSMYLSMSAPTVSYNNGARSLHAAALQPIISLCTLRRPRYRCRRNTRYLVPCQGFQGWDFHPADRAELRSAHKISVQIRQWVDWVGGRAGRWVDAWVFLVALIAVAGGLGWMWCLNTQPLIGCPTNTSLCYQLRLWGRKVVMTDLSKPQCANTSMGITCLLPNQAPEKSKSHK